VTFVERARMAGVDVRHEITEGMVHVFHAFTFLPAGREAYRSIARFVYGVPAQRGLRATG
jgi:acetyl esterase/lipase